MGVVSPPKHLQTTIRRLLGAVLVAAGLGRAPSVWSGEGIATEPVEPLTIAAPGPQPVVGERLSFHGYWMGIPVGHGWLEVKDIVEVEGRRAYRIEAEGHTNEVLSKLYPIHDTFQSYLDVETLQPLRFEKHQQEGWYRADEVVTFDHTSRQAIYRSLRNKSVKTIELPEAFQDLISALYWFRTQPLQQPLEPDRFLSVNLYTDEKIYRTDLRLQGPQILELLKRGTFSCLVVEPKASFKGILVKRGRIWAYFTADAHRLPLLAKATTPWGPMSAVLDETALRAVLGEQPLHTPSRQQP